MMRWFALFIALLLPTQAMALSCMPYNAVQGFKDAAKSKDQYVAVLGKLSFDQRKAPSHYEGKFTAPQIRLYSY